MPILKSLSRVAFVVPVLLVGTGLRAAPKPKPHVAPPLGAFRVDRIPQGTIEPDFRRRGDVIPPCEMVFDYRNHPLPTKYMGRNGVPHSPMSIPRQHWTFHDGPAPVR